MKQYRVLCIDDRPEALESFIELAAIKGISIEIFKYHKEGMDILCKDIHAYDAIILDALGLKESDDEAEGYKGLQYSITTISGLQTFIPRFIYSAYIEKDEFSQIRDLYSDEDIYTKGKDNKKLLAKIIEEADHRIETQIKHQYHSFLKALTTIGADSTIELFRNILVANKTGDISFEDTMFFTQLRIALEYVFRKANSIGILHDACIPNGKVNLTDSSLFLAGEQTKHCGVKCTKAHFPKIIADNVKNLLFITGGASHTSEVDPTKEINFQEYKKAINTPYLLFSLTFQLIDTVLWFNKYADENPDKAKNKSLWLPQEESQGEWQEGIVLNLNTKGFAFFKPKFDTFNSIIPPKIVADNNLSDNDQIYVIIEDYEDKKSNEVKTRVKELKRI
ncbi:MAG: hypothetical protein ACOYOV_03025 [Bacteroidales bacterium]